MVISIRQTKKTPGLRVGPLTLWRKAEEPKVTAPLRVGTTEK